jgi:hypothetical protein
VSRVQGLEVCTSTFYQYYGISRTKFYHYRGQFLDGKRNVTQATVKSVFHTTDKGGMLTRQASAWLKNFAREVGHVVPNTGEMRLPFPDMRMVWSVYEGDMKRRYPAQGGKNNWATYQHFCQVWVNGCDHIKTARKKDGFCVCAKCSTYAAELGLAPTLARAQEIKY